MYVARPALTFRHIGRPVLAPSARPTTGMTNAALVSPPRLAAAQGMNVAALARLHIVAATSVVGARVRVETWRRIRIVAHGQVAPLSIVDSHGSSFLVLVLFLVPLSPLAADNTAVRAGVFLLSSPAGQTHAPVSPPREAETTTATYAAAALASSAPPARPSLAGGTFLGRASLLLGRRGLGAAPRAATAMADVFLSANTPALASASSFATAVPTAAPVSAAARGPRLASSRPYYLHSCTRLTSFRGCPSNFCLGTLDTAL